MLQRKTIGKVSLRHVEKGANMVQGLIESVCVYVGECRFWTIPDGTFMCMDKTFCKPQYSLCHPWSLDAVFMTFILPI